MRDIPECLSRRYRALDDLIKELTRSSFQRGSQTECVNTCGNDAGLKLLCDFWNILKEDPDYDLVHAVQQRMGLVAENSHAFRPENIACFMAGKCKKDAGEDQRRDALNRIRKICSSGSDNNPRCCASKSPSPASGSDLLPLSKVLCNLKEAASFDKKCNVRINELMDTQKVLQDQIKHLEHREKEGVQLLKQADCMWTCMEDTYQKKINESLERQKTLLQQLKEVEASTVKWRKNKKDLELQLVSIGKCQEEIKEKIHQKNSDLKCMDVEIEDFKKRIENNKKDAEAVKKTFGTKKQASEAKIAKIAAEISKLQKVVIEERKYKNNKEHEGIQYVGEARAELQKICKVLLQKKIENEDLKAEKDALNFEIDVLKQTCDQCKDKCKNRQQDISNEIAKVEKQIKEFKVKCTRCHEYTDTIDIRKCCTDCPRCIEERDCILEKDHCSPDHTMDCVCMSVKQKFLDNVFDNMYTVLERQVKTGPGKAVADAVLKCLKRSRNGKLDVETRKILQDFILTTVKKNLNLTIVGGAVKTRCEMDPETYKQLMLCLQQVKVVCPPKEDKSTPAKKDSCRRWGGTSECNCPKGPKACICLKKAPPPPQDPTLCPPPTQDKEDEGVVITCPHKDVAACGADCAMHAVPSRVGADIAAWRPDPCREQSCGFSKNMRAAQCMLGPESLVSLPKAYMSTLPHVPDLQDLDDFMTCKCGRSTKPCNCQDRRSQPRERIIEEVMGTYGDMPPIDKVNIEDEFGDAESNRRTNSVQNYIVLSSNIKKGCTCLSNSIISDSIIPLVTIHSFSHEKTVKNSNIDELVTLYNNSASNEFVKINEVDHEINAGIAVILQPQFTGTCSKKYQNAIDAENKKTEKSNKVLPTADTGILGRKVCDTVKKLMKDIIVPKVANNKYTDSEVEWLTVDTLMKEIISLAKISDDNGSNITANEVEMKTEYLEGLTTNKQDSKQLKAGISKPCDKVTCGTLWDEAKKNIDRSYSLIENEIPKESYSVSCSVEQFTKVPSIQTDIFSDAQKHLSTESSLPSKPYDTKNVTFGNGTKHDKSKERLQEMINDGDHLGDQFTELTTTASGNLAIELDEKIIGLIEEKSSENPNLFVSLDETESEHYTINFSPSENTINRKQRFSIKKSPSGTRLLEGHKEFVKKFKQSEVNDNIISPYLDCNIKLEKGVCQSICDCKYITDESGNVSHISDKKYMPDQKSYLSELQRLWEEGVKDIAIKVMGRNDVCKKMKGILIRTSSNTIAVDVTNISSFGDMTFKTGECPALMAPTPSDTFLLQISQDIDFNVLLRRSTGGGIILVPTDSVLKSVETTQHAYETKPKNEFFKVKVKSFNKLVEDPPAVLKMTPSYNYKLVLDKEYEKTFSQTIENCIGDDSECLVELGKTNSGNFMVILDNHDMDDTTEPNALLVKSPSGNIKMLVDDPELNGADSISPKKMSTSSSSAFGQLLDKLLPSSREIKRDNLKETIIINMKSSSDSHLYEKLKIKLPNHKDLLEPSATLTRTASGQYAVVLNKESKKAFVNHLRSYLSGSQGLIPIKRTESGEITINLNSDNEINYGYGSLKISPSGNIYVTVDEKVIEGMVEDVKRGEGSSLGDELSKHIIESIKCPVNKAVTTTCNAKPECSSCDTSKCVCKELQLSPNRHDRVAKYNSTVFKSKKYCIDLMKVKKTPHCGYKIGDPQKCEEPGCVGSKSDYRSSDMSPHIVIKPCDCRPVLTKNPRSEECCYVVEAICPYHIDRYDTVSNELLEISGLCNKTLEKRNLSLSKQGSPDNAPTERSWDSLKYLPPQLPMFLQDVHFR